MILRMNLWKRTMAKNSKVDSKAKGKAGAKITTMTEDMIHKE